MVDSYRKPALLGRESVSPLSNVRKDTGVSVKREALMQKQLPWSQSSGTLGCVTDGGVR